MCIVLLCNTAVFTALRVTETILPVHTRTGSLDPQCLMCSALHVDWLVLIIAKDAATTRHFVDFPNGYFGSQESSMKENLNAYYDALFKYLATQVHLTTNIYQVANNTSK
jgi:hypothetical protein